MKTKLITLGLLLASPLLTFAQANSNFSSLQSAINSIAGLVQTAIPVLIAVAVLVFIFGVVKFIVNAGNEEERGKGVKFIIYGLIGLFVIFSLFALINILQSTFGLGDTDNVIDNRDIPYVLPN